ncbi:DOPA-like domain-containing protein [Sphaerosporella brunnea]|uniref:DOPA-like domain-containing protein n=1 Tax=Sphaerosporella brunnea TaxID=1250544 RepID=A0A5J5EZR0_9PEZI|nr:DOPA-like domain-containing protein [Sphaerosporella brunnea]
MVTRRTDLSPHSGPVSARTIEEMKDPSFVLANEVKEWHFHIYFNTSSPSQRAAALNLRDAVLALRKAGVFAAVPLKRVNTAPIGPHPAGSYEIWVPRESFAAVFSFLALNHGTLSVLVHPLTREEVADHSTRKAWIGEPWPVLLDVLDEAKEKVPLQYPSLGLGYSSTAPEMSKEERERWGAELEEKVKGEEDAA